jgi:hypothetical protein
MKRSIFPIRNLLILWGILTAAAVARAADDDDFNAYASPVASGR